MTEHRIRLGRTLFWVAVFLLIAAAVVPRRYQFISVGHGELFRIDRWTGGVVLIDNTGVAQRVTMPRSRIYSLPGE